MKNIFRLFAVLAIVFLVTGICFAQATTVNLSLNLMPYIETMPGPTTWDLGNTFHYGSYNVENIYGANNSWNLAYANCPFSVTIAGNNPANQGVPRFARLQEGAHAGGVYDVLPTLYAIHITTNTVSDLFYGTWLQGAHQFPYTKQYSEAPHNGQVKMDMQIYANAPIASEAVPTRKTIINPAFTDEQSADAGVYTCYMTITLGPI